MERNRHFSPDQSPIHDATNTNSRPLLRDIDPRFLRSSSALSEREIFKMKILLEQEQEDMKWFEEGIERVGKLLDSLRAEKRALETNIEKRRSIISSLWKLPTEVLELIFDLVCQSVHHGIATLVIDYTSYGGKVVVTEKSLSVIPITLSHVCSRWRYVMLGCPRLWSTIFFAFENLPKYAHNLLLTFLENSKGYPLDLCVDMGGMTTVPDTTCREALVQHLSRCTQLSVVGQTCNKFLAMDPAPEVSFPNLTHFYSDVADEAIQPNNWFWKALESRAPKLDEVDIPFVLPSTALPYQQLTDLTVSWLFSRHFRDFLSILQSSLGQLRSLRISSIVHDPTLLATTLVPADITMPFLATLILDNCSDNVEAPIELNDPLLGCLFASLTMPSIHTFMLSCTDRKRASRTTQPVNWPSSLLGMLSRSLSSLRQMTLFIQSFQGFLGQPLSTLLRHTPHLTDFDLRIAGKSETPTRYRVHRNAQWNEYLPAFLSDLTSFRDPVLPDLTSLAIHIADMPKSDVVENLAKLANSRSGAALDPSIRANHGSEQPVVSSLTTLQLKRYRSFVWSHDYREACAPPPPGRLVDTPELEEAIETARQRGVDVVVEDVARYLEDIDSNEEG
ncbi:hypothetical protein AAF712_010448 [Marasmius tenuissimus]|uniref:F-box domain-containing protein n=1 Tax=Marasmius tenuissimus TaxID=585030 RepID=A0ABR2ZNV0_9AGAR